jgi:hypothetical protein
LKGSISVVGNSPSSKADGPANGDLNSGKGGGAKAQQYRSRLAQLQAQMDQTDQKIVQLRGVESGATSGNSGLQLHHGYNMEPIPDQIKQLEDKKQQLQAKIDALYDEARKNGIEPGELR